MDHAIVFSIFLIFAGAAVVSTVALFTRQSLMVAYMLLGMIIGPSGLGWASDSYVIQQIGDIGIIFLLFLLGLHLDPKNLIHMLRKTTWVALVSSLIFASVGYWVARFYGFGNVECLVIGAAMMFSSTIIGLKLLPPTMLHHTRVGGMMVSILLLQDLIAIMVLLMIHGATLSGFGMGDVGLIVLSLPVLLAVAFLFEHYILMPLFTRFERVREYLFLLAIAWCLSLSELANLMGLSHEIGAFIAGVSIASNSISLYLAECLKPVRDFFLVMFFFSVGASFNLHFLPSVAMPSILLAALYLIAKPAVFRFLLRQVGEDRQSSWEVGFRLGQVSEFSLLVGYIAASSSLISDTASYLIQATTMLTFLFSSYFVVFRYATPIASSEQAQNDFN